MRNQAERDFDEFERDIVDTIEQHLTLSDEASVLAWKLGREHAWRIWSAMVRELKTQPGAAGQETSK